MLVCYAGSFVNELYQIFSAPDVAEELAQGFRLFIWLPSIVSPAAAYIFERYLPVSWWILWVTCNELVLSIRLFEEGSVIYAFKMMMATMKIAAPELLAFSSAIIILMAVSAEAHGNQFGVFSSLYSDSIGDGRTRGLRPAHPFLRAKSLRSSTSVRPGAPLI